jgi:hypothetical protein
MTTECQIDVRPGAPPRAGHWPWASIFLALVAVVIVLAVELWAAREAPAFDGITRSQVAAEVNSTLARVVAASVLIGPAD